MRRIATMLLALSLVVADVRQLNAQVEAPATPGAVEIDNSVPASQDTDAEANESEGPVPNDRSDETDTGTLGKSGKEAPVGFRQEIAGKWILDSVDVKGETFGGKSPPPEDPSASPAVQAGKQKALDALRVYAVAIFDHDRLTFGTSWDELADPWSYSLEEEADPRRIVLSTGGETINGLIWQGGDGMVLLLPVGGGDFPKDFETDDNDNLLLRYGRDETDPQWLKREAARFHDQAAKLESEGTHVEHKQYAVFLRERAASLEREADVREQYIQTMEQVKELKRAEKHQSAKKRGRDADLLRCQAEQIAAEREDAWFQRSHEQQRRDKLNQLNVRAASLRSEGRFSEAEAVDAEIRDMLRERDPELQRANDLKRRASQAQLDGKHEDAELFLREANRLLENVKQRWGSPGSAPEPQPRSRDLADSAKDSGIRSLPPSRSGRQTAFKQHETRARQLAQAYSDRLLDSDRQHPDARKLKADLRKAVAAAFEARQQRQRAELAKLRERFTRIQQLIENRERIKDRIIDHRVAELLNPALRWNGPTQTVDDRQYEVDGIVTAVDNGLVDISVGHDDGIRKGMTADVFRDRSYVGRIAIVKAEPDRSVARIEMESQRGPIRIRDRVLARLDSRGAANETGSLGAPSAVYQGQAPHAITQIGGSTGHLDAPSGPQASAQVLIRDPQGATLNHQSEFDDAESDKRIPRRLRLTTGQTARVTLSNIPEYEGVKLTGSIELAPVTRPTQAFLEHNAIPMGITSEDIEQAISGKLVTKVIYLPNAENTEIALAGVESLVSVRLDPGVDPLQMAQRQGYTLAIFRLGNRSPDDAKDDETVEGEDQRRDDRRPARRISR